MNHKDGKNRVVITGIGWVTPLGCDIEDVWQRLLAGQCAIAKTTLFDASTFPSTFSAQVRDEQLDDEILQSEIHATAGRNSRFALVAAAHAWRDAGLDKTPPDPTQIGIYLGAGEGSLDFDNFISLIAESWQSETQQMDWQMWGRLALQRMNVWRELEQEPNMPSAHIASQFALRGPHFNCLTACAASTQAIGEAVEIIRRGDALMMVGGGCHSMIHPLGVTGFNRLTALSTRNDDPAHSARPFDRTRDGFVLGEGAGIIILERLDHALQRGAKIYAEVAGYGSTADAFRVTDIHEDGRGAIAAIRAALDDAGMQPSQIDYISAHGTGTIENDPIETLAVKEAFGPYAKKVPISSVKSMLGHLIAAAGAVELITCILAIRDGIVPPTINLNEPDPACDLDYVPNKARRVRVDAAMSNSFGFGGQNDTLIVRRYVR